jgi:hypothetical protein
MALTLKSYQSLLGNMIAQLLANSDITALRPGSVALTLLEAAAANDFSQEGRLLQLLTIRSIDSATGSDLDGLAKEMGVTPSRIGAQASTAALTIKETAFTKVSSLVFSGAAAPAAGDTQLLVTNASSFASSGTVYIGRGTATSESVAYTAKANSGLYWTLTLSAPLAKNHLSGEEVVLGQGGNRTVPSGTIARVPASGGQPAINFKTISNYTMLDGEDTLTGVSAVGSVAGLSGNVGSAQIQEFTNAPWATASVTNPGPATGGTDPETDPELRQRIRDWVHNIGRGTERAIKRVVVGTYDSEESKRVVSAFLSEPTVPGKLGTLYIDDGTGYQPPFTGVGLETLVTKATGGEKRFQFQQYPMVKAQAGSVSTEPFALHGGEFIRAVIDGVAEERALSSANWRSPGTVTAQEVVEAINSTFLTIEARAKDGQVFISPAADDPNYLQVTAATLGTDANSVLNCPTRKIRSVNLYLNDVPVDKNGTPAQLQSVPYGQWPAMTSPQTAQFSVDGIVGPVLTINDTDFLNYSSSLSLTAASLQDWIKVLAARVAGVNVTDNGDGTLILASNKGAVAGASIAIVGGTLSGRIFTALASSTAVPSGFTLNRLLGQAELVLPLSSGDNLKAGTTLTAGFALTPARASFDLSSTSGSPAILVFVTDAQSTNVIVNQVANSVTFSAPNSYTQRITGVASQFSNVLTGDWAHLYNMPANGLYRVVAVAGDGSSVDLWSPSPAGAGTVTPDAGAIAMSFFRTKGLPFEVKFTISGAATPATVVSDFNSQAVGAIAEIMDSGAVRFRAIDIDSSAALAVPVVAGKASSFGITVGTRANGDPSTGAAESGDLLGLPYGLRLIQTADLTVPYNTFDATTNFTDKADVDRPIVVYAGAASRQYREVQNKTGAAELTLRDGLIVPSVGLGPDLASAQASGLEFGEADNMVFILDNDPTRKTFDIPLYVELAVAGPSVPSTTQIDLADASGALIGSSSKWAGHRFDDYRAWFQAWVDSSTSVSSSSKLVATATQFGPNGELIKFGVFYPTAPATVASASYSIDEATAKVNVSAYLPGGTERTTGITAGMQVGFSSTLASAAHYLAKVQFQYPVTVGNVQVGDICSLQDTSFNALNKGYFKVLSTTNFQDIAKSWSFPTESAVATVSGGGTAVAFTTGNLTEPLRIGDTVLITGVTDTVLSSNATSITVNSGASFTPAGGTVVVNAVTFTYASYAGSVLSGVSPNPSAIATAGSTVSQSLSTSTIAVSAVADQSHCTMASPLLTGSGYTVTVAHGCLKASSAPSFTVAAGDWVQVAGNTLIVQSVIDTTHFVVNTPFAFAGTVGGQVTRITATLDFTAAANAENDVLTSSLGVRFYALGTATVADVVAAVNGTAGAKDVITLSNPGGSGSITLSTLDFTRSSSMLALQNGEGFVLSCVNASPALTLKTAIAQAPVIGNKVRLIPMTPRNIVSHFQRPQISGLSVAANVDLVEAGRRVQVSTLVPGGDGQVYPVGGRGAGTLTMAISSGRTAGSYGIVSVDKSATTSVAPGHTISLTQTGRARKGWTGSAPTNSTNATVTVLGAGFARFTYGVPLASMLSYTHSGTVLWRVTQISNGRYRFHTVDPAASVDLSNIAADAWVFIGNGSTAYAGTTPQAFFSAGNRGWFQVVGAGTRYFDIDASMTEEVVSCSSAPFVFVPYYAARPGDQLVVTNTSSLNLANQGTFTISSVNSTTSVDFVNANAVSQGPLAIGDSSSVGINDQGFMTKRTVALVAPDPANPASSALLYFTPGTDANLLSVGANARVSFPNRLGFKISPVPGVSGYQYWTGLKRAAQRVLDGWAQDTISYPGVRAAGAAIEVREPQIQRVSISMKIRTNSGVSLTQVADAIKSAIVGYVNSLGLGESVVLSEIVSLVQSQSGVDTVVLVSPTLDSELIAIGSKSVARTSPSSITLSNA